jgi:SOS-response transcriptional repressor LexA
MSDPRKTIPIVAVAPARDADAEISGCAELEPFALRVVGDSMAPEFLDGHVIILDPGLPATHGAFVVAEVDGETIFRQFWMDEGRAVLRALDDRYPSIALTGGHRIVGVVTQRAGKRRVDRKRYE